MLCRLQAERRGRPDISLRRSRIHSSYWSASGASALEEGRGYLVRAPRHPVLHRVNTKRMGEDARGLVDNVVHQRAPRRVEPGEVADAFGNFMIYAGRVPTDAEPADDLAVCVQRDATPIGRYVGARRLLTAPANTPKSRSVDRSPGGTRRMVPSPHGFVVLPSLAHVATVLPTSVTSISEIPCAFSGRSSSVTVSWRRWSALAEWK
jgi:hypothetical protein